MKKRNTACIVLATMMVCVTLAAVTPISAVAPETTVVNLDNWYTKGPSPDGPCPFTIDVHVVGMVMDKKWYDDNENLAQEMVTYAGNKYYLHANGKQATVLNSGRTLITYVSPQETLFVLNGQEWVWLIPGYGVVSGEIGSQSWSEVYDDDGNLLEVIVHRLLGNIMHTDVTPLLCEYLGP